MEAGPDDALEGMRLRSHHDDAWVVPSAFYAVEPTVKMPISSILRRLSAILCSRCLSYSQLAILLYYSERHKWLRFVATASGKVVMTKVEPTLF